MWKPILVLPFLLVVVCSFGSDEKFLKKYALMKIFESCFGQDVVKEIRKELKTACAKCAASNAVPFSTQPVTTTQTPTDVKNDENPEAQNTMYANQQSLAVDRVHQAILAYRPNVFSQPAAFRPYSAMPSMPSAPYYQQFQPYANPSPMFYAPNNFGASPFPTAYPTSPFQYPYLNQPYYDTSRMSRNMDFTNQLEILSTKMNHKVSNITCVMQELGYLDQFMEPNYEKISLRISNLPVAQQLKDDIQDGVTYCQQFSQCIPEPKKGASPLTKELSRPMLFFKCYKYKKLEACIMKDVREKVSNFTDDDFDGENVLKRSGKSMKLDAEETVLSSSLYDFLYGADADLELGSIL